jgi:processing peptidase subunit alpha
MYRTAASRLRALKGRVGNLVAARHATSSAAPASSLINGGLFSWYTGEKTSSLPPLQFPLEGINFPPPVPDYVESPQTKITTLPNGFRIASETSTNPTATIGLYVDSGSIYETPESTGATHLLERMAFRSTKNRSHLRIVREVESIGGYTSASASREQMRYSFDAIKTYLPQIVELVVDCVRNPVFLEWEVAEEVKKVRADIAEMSNNPQALLLEAIHSAGYSGALANPLLAPESALDRIDSSLLAKFVAENYTASRMVLAASGVDHEELLSLAEPLLSDLPNEQRPKAPESVYLGGNYSYQLDVPNTHFAVGFELPGGWQNVEDTITTTVLQLLLGGGGSFSAGGPGKGMHSRLYLRVLNKNPEITSFSAFNSIFNKTGIFGIYGATSPEFASRAIEIAAEELLRLAIPGQVEKIEVDRAKAATKSAVLMNLESRAIVSEDIGTQILTYGEREPLEHFLTTVEAITPKDICRLAQKLISTPLTLASFGNVTNVPAYKTLTQMFNP